MTWGIEVEEGGVGDAYGGLANGIPRNLFVLPLLIPVKVAWSSLTWGEVADALVRAEESTAVTHSDRDNGGRKSRCILPLLVLEGRATMIYGMSCNSVIYVGCVIKGSH